MKKLAWILLIIGGLNWGIIGVAGVDVVGFLGEVVSRIVYVLVGLSAVMALFKGKCGKCDSGASHGGGASSGGSEM
jgi:uncharacterized protein